MDDLLDKDNGQIKNPAAKLIYDQLYIAFKELIESFNSILGEIDAVFAPAEKKYLSDDDLTI